MDLVCFFLNFSNLVAIIGYLFAKIDKEAKAAFFAPAFPIARVGKGIPAGI